MQKLFYMIGETESIPFARKIVTLFATLVLLALIGYLDQAAGREISFGVFYFLPIWIVTWNFGGRTGLLASLVCAWVWFQMDKVGSPVFPNPFVPYWNALVRFVYFSAFALLLASVRIQLQQSTAEVKRLSGLLPICSNCKKIRDDDGRWQLIEEYVRTRSGAEFTHGLCPDCARDLYPDLADAWSKDNGKSQR